jgi:hypothetical protein
VTRLEKAKALKLKAVLKQLQECETDTTPVMRNKLTKQAVKLVDFLLKIE